MGHISEISFPGLGIGKFEINDTAFAIFGHEIKWYGIIICVGIIAAFTYFALRAKQAGIKFDTVVDFTLFTVPIAIVGARIYYVIFYGVPFKDIYKIWEGGLAIYGAIIVGAITVIIMCRIKKVKFMAFADMIAPGVMLGQAIGRWGNFTNGEAYGAETDIFCRMGLSNWHTGYQTVYVHPTFLYESLWNIIGFVLINIFYKKRKFNGEPFLWYAAWYGLGRTFIELLRQDSLYMGNIRVSSLFGTICFAVCLPLIVAMHIFHKKKVKAGVIEKNEIADITALLGLQKRGADDVCKANDVASEKSSEPEESEISTDDAKELSDTEDDEYDDDIMNDQFLKMFDTSEIPAQNDSEDGNDN